MFVNVVSYSIAGFASLGARNSSGGIGSGNSLGIVGQLASSAGGITSLFRNTLM